MAHTLLSAVVIGPGFHPIPYKVVAAITTPSLVAQHGAINEVFRRDAAAWDLSDWTHMNIELYNFHTANVSRFGLPSQSPSGEESDTRPPRVARGMLVPVLPRGSHVATATFVATLHAGVLIDAPRARPALRHPRESPSGSGSATNTVLLSHCGL